MKKLKRNKILIEKYKVVNEHPGFEKDYYSRTETRIYKICYIFIRLVEWLASYDGSYYEKIEYFHLMGSISNISNEKLYW